MADETKIVGLKVGVDTGGSTAEVNKLKDASEELLDGLDGLEKGTVRTGHSFNDLSTTIGGIKGIIAGVGIAAFIKEVTRAANELDRATLGLSSVARYAGEDMGETLTAAKALTKDGLMPLSDAATSLKNLLSRGFSLDEATKLMDRFKDSAAFGRQGSLEFGEAIRGATEGLKNEMSQLVDNAGVTKNVSIMWKEYAAQIGSTVDKLTMAQKRQAEFNGIMKETEAQIGNAALMSETFAGAQSRANQKTTELKQTLGVALQPALQGILTIMGPLVTGLRDMIYWVETLGARSGGVYDKIRARLEERFSLPKEGQAMGLKGIHERIAARDAEIDKNVDSVIADIVARSTGSTLPNIGKDPGARRKDTIIPDKPAKDTDATDQLWNNYLSSLKGFNDQIRQLNPDLTEFQKKSQAIDDTLAQQLEKFKGFENNPGVQKYVDSLKTAAAGAKSQLTLDYNLQGNEMTPRQQYQFDDAARLSKWAALRADYDRKEEQDQFTHGTAMLTIQQQIDQALMGEDAKKTGDYEQMILDQYDFEQEQAEAQLQWTLDHTALEEEQKQRIIQQYQQKYIQSEQSKAIALRNLDRDTNNMRIKAASDYTSAAMNFTNALSTFAHGKNRALFELNKVAGIANATMSTYEAANKAMASVPYPYNIAAAASVIALGLSNVASIASTSFGSGNAAAGGTGGGTIDSPVVTQPSVSSPQQQVQIVINGAIGERRWFEDNLPTILQDFASRNVSTGVVYA